MKPITQLQVQSTPEQVEKGAVKKCLTCNIEKPLEAFTAALRMKDGHLNQCKECRSARRRADAAQRSIKDPRLNVQVKTCYECRVERPSLDFYRDRSRIDGLTTRCRHCRYQAHLTNRAKAVARYENGQHLPLPLSLTCRVCKESKAPSEFTRRKDSPIGLANFCRACSREQARQRAREPEHTLRVRLKARYGLSLEEYKAMAVAQNNRCAICGDVETTCKEGVPQRLCVDHDHVTGKVRSLLCVRCNLVLGHTKDDVDRILKMADYLRAHHTALE